MKLEEDARRLEEEKQKLQDDNQHQSDVIEGLTEEIPLADLRQRLNEIVRKGSPGDQGAGWRMLYREFEKKYHINIGQRKSYWSYKGSYLDYVELELKMLRELYEVACKLFEGSYKQLTESWDKFLTSTRKLKRN